MRIGKRQEGQNAVIMENLARHAAVRLFGADCGHQRVMAVIPEGQRNIRFVTQPGIGAVGTHHQTRGQHVATFKSDKRVVFAPRHLLKFRRCDQRDVAALLRFLPQRVVDHRVFNDMSKVAVPHAFIVKRDTAKAVFVPHFHPVIATGTERHDFRPDAKVRQ